MLNSTLFTNRDNPPRNAFAIAGRTALRSTCWMVAVVLSVHCVHASEQPDLIVANPAAAAGQKFTVPGTDYGFIVGISQVMPGSIAPAEALVTALAAWVASELGFPPVAELPRIQIASPEWMIGLRHTGNISEATFHPSDTVAVYDDRDGTIYLPEGWTGRTPAELSVLVHELVHHLQNKTGQRFACGGEREKAAYEAQQRWLTMFGRDLFQEFEVDALTLLVRTNCGF
jgi:hypothetical protein